MAELRATPYANPLTGLSNDAIQGLLAFMQDKRRTQQLQGLGNLLESTGIPKTVERAAYAESPRGLLDALTNVNRANVPFLKPETAEAAMTLAPIAAPVNRALMQATKGLPIGASIKNVGDDLLSYRGSHTAPNRSFGAPLNDLTGGGQMYPADVYSSKAAQLYGGGMPYDQKAFSIAQQYKDKPNALVTIYRAVPKDISNSEKLATLEKEMAAYMKRGTLPKDAENYSNGSKWYDAAYEKREQLRKMPDEPSNEVNKINSGDWVTLTREYAKDHGESALNGEYKIISQKVKAKDVFTNADSIHEFGYQPEIPAPRQAALDTAQKNAALPIEKGGLGLPKDNTPEMRAQAMGFETPTYHGTNEDIGVFNVEGKGKTSGAGAFLTSNPTAAETYVSSSGGGNILPLLLRKDDFLTANARGRNWADIFTNELGAKAGKKRYTPEDLNLDKNSATSTDELGMIASELGLKGAEIRNVKDLGPNSHVMRAKEYLSERYGIIPDETWSNVSGKQFDEAQKYMKQFYESQKGDIYAIQDPSLIRSRFAAFDPMRKNEPDILAGLLPLGLLADEEKRKEIQSLLE